MTFTLADAQPLFLMSIYKPILFTLALAGWAWVANRIDKDSAWLNLPRLLINAGNMGVAALAMSLWLVLPMFWLGFVVAVLLLAGSMIGYTYYRNQQVPEKDRWTFTLEMFAKRIDRYQTEQARKQATLTLTEADGRPITVPVGEDPMAPAHAVLEQLMDFALPRLAETIDISVGAQQASMSAVIDGVRYPQPQIDSKLALTLVDYLKTRAGLDVNERRRKQSGRVHLDAGEQGKHTLEVVTAGSTREITLTLRLDPSMRVTVPFDHLGLLDIQRQQIERALEERGKVAIVACPPRQGMTTTLYSLVTRHDPYTQSVMTLEEQVMTEIEGVSHETLEPGMAGEAVNQKLAAVLRRDPQVVMLSRLTDVSQAKTMAGVARDVRLYTGMYQDDTTQALRTWIKAVGDQRKAAAALGLIVSQRLVRRLCHTCRVPFKPDPAALRKLNLPVDKVQQLYKHSGQVMVRNRPTVCPDCVGIGYRGRLAVFEVMALDDEARRLIAEGQLDQLRSYLRKNRMLLLQEAALSKVVEGLTSISEVTRVLSKEPPAAAAPSQPKAQPQA